METKIHHHYNIDYKPVTEYTYRVYPNQTEIGTELYGPFIEDRLPKMLFQMNNDPHTRQATLTVNHWPYLDSCLMNMIFNYVDSDLYVLVTFRSQALEFVELDTELINYIVTRVIDGFNYKVDRVAIDVIVANFHSRKTLNLPL